MENNIFENAKFGDKFVTRDGRIAMFHSFMDNNEYVNIIYPNTTYIYVLNKNTCSYLSKERLDIGITTPDDIISRYQEPIDEEKLTDEATEYANEKWAKEWPYIPYESGTEEPDVIKDFKAGYRKAKEE